MEKIESTGHETKIIHTDAIKISRRTGGSGMEYEMTGERGHYTNPHIYVNENDDPIAVISILMKEMALRGCKFDLTRTETA